jgi:ribonuclease D
VFDTQIAYKYVNTHTSFRVGWNKLCQLYGAPSNPLKETFHGIYRTNPAIWKQRPLTEGMMIYASADVRHLHTFHTKMSQSIKPSQKAGFEKLCRDAILRSGDDHNCRF